ncbi:alpha/beta hydrolase [uncultured Bacteroides sp.]|uniref:alpha/beta hydrolase n=1 Tax=uncultured Bacteroides sp. TaxID=162156 RepID=UPI0026097EE3|nr:alpha/beta hydrolase [uncultured Bacteroides sp.]
MKKKILITTGIVAAVIIAILTGGSLYMLDYSLRPENRGKDMEGSMAFMRETYPQIVPWLDSLEQHKALRDTFITAPDGIKMHAFFVRASKPTNKTAVIVHGYTDNAIRMFHIGYMYSNDFDYNILLPDLRYTGLTEGDAIQMGWLDRKDVIQWIDTAPAIFGDSLQTVVHGISMGAATTMMVSGEKLPGYIRCFVEDCGYTSVWDQFGKELKEQFGLPKFPLLYTASWMCDLQNGWNFTEASALKQVAKCRLPMFFIHGDKDDYVPTWMVYKLYDAKPQPKEIWVVPGADHAHSYRYYPEEYTEHVKRFVNKYIH